MFLVIEKENLPTPKKQILFKDEGQQIAVSILIVRRFT
ncbi:hypothetical protein LEP1GSC193_4443 [Leptospira alstonii serovar Pingchang str. 80-412]|uniref:Uncharacterized protein n=2 Tax=Leptospira alstonii TaxID=28452 RepID=M6D5N0_9LEPT|nr:hypothetical protein LEP1GSC194_2915 [Leptospira alstonii serovar Sichuan str. 79601]EQA80279.1 hypothetical protein LEP1GSC193_4443 [Leptospira alstonii serovar Pingchang str. 80-412]